MVKKRKRTKKINLIIIPFLFTLFTLVFLLVYYSPEIIMVFSKEKLIEQDQITTTSVSTAKNNREYQKIEADIVQSTTGGQGHGLYLREEDSTIDEQININGPKITKGVIDPKDVVPGVTQTMTIYVEDEKHEILSVVAEIKNDKDTIKKELKLKSGTKKKGVWEEKWIVKDVHKTTYNTKLIATNSKREEGEIIISWTDACSCFSMGMTWYGMRWYIPSGYCYGYSNLRLIGQSEGIVVQSGGQFSYGTYVSVVGVPPEILVILNGGVLKSACP